MDKYYILVVDDNHINRLFFESSLKKLDLMVSSVENGFEAIELCRQHSFDLILMDIRMDGIDGIETAQAIKKLETQKNTPILAFSAERFEHSQYPEFQSSLLKPVRQDELKRILLTYLPEKPIATKYFNETLALQISHQDIDIVKKLRGLLVKQLPEDWRKIKLMHTEKNWSDLNAYLHNTLGAARTCAASLLSQCIEQLQASVKKEQSDIKALKQLKSVINQTIKIANTESK